MVTIRIFRVKEDAEKAKRLLESVGISVSIQHDKLFGVPIEKFGVPARYHLRINRKDIAKTAQLLKAKTDKHK